MTFDADGSIPRHCTRCDYDVEGLPDDAGCPECGQPVDRRFVVLRGHRVGVNASAQSSSGGRAVAIIVGLAALQSLSPLRALRSDLRSGDGWGVFADLAWLAMWSGFAAFALWQRFRDSGPPAQLWLGEQGYLIRGRRDPDVQPSRPVAARTLCIIAAVLVVAAIGLAQLEPPLAVIALVPTIAAALLLCSLWLRRNAARRRPATVAVASPERPLSLVVWQPDTAFTIESVSWSTDLRELRIEPRGGPPERRVALPTQRFRTVMTDAQAERLAESVRAWTSAANS